MTAVVGLDLSLRMSGIAEADGTLHVVRTGPTKGVERLIMIEKRVLLAAHRAEQIDPAVLAVIEGYGYEATNRAHEIGELGGIIRLALFRIGVRVLVIGPGTLKKYATGVGNAGKYEVLLSAHKRLGYEGADDNEADALWLRAIGMELIGQPLVAMPSVNRAALKGVVVP